MSEQVLSKQEINRYTRHISLEEIGQAGQEKLKKASALVVGAGGLGAPVLQYLAAAGVGTLGIGDNDLITENNLPRQILYTKKDVGMQKAIVARSKLMDYNPYLKYNIHNILFTDERVLKIIQDYDIIVDCTDNLPARYLLNDACIILKKPLVHAALYKYQGQVSVFNYNNGPSYRCLYPYPPRSEKILNSGGIGIFGALVGIIGSIQAAEAIKMITGLGEVLSGKVFVYNMLNSSGFTFNIKRNDENFDVEELIDYEEFCRPSL
ncbi:MAG: HesA/MoeB/ThiF family protein [Bacteroidales bacterium]|nr:HesA/MoeB/ThiF family protein [Bacteroidales bacterium]